MISGDAHSGGHAHTCVPPSVGSAHTGVTVQMPQCQSQHRRATWGVTAPPPRHPPPKQPIPRMFGCSLLVPVLTIQFRTTTTQRDMKQDQPSYNSHSPGACVHRRRLSHKRTRVQENIWIYLIHFGAAAPLPRYSFLDYMPRTLQICCSTLVSPLAFSISQWSLSFLSLLLSILLSETRSISHSRISDFRFPYRETQEFDWAQEEVVLQESLEPSAYCRSVRERFLSEVLASTAGPCQAVFTRLLRDLHLLHLSHLQDVHVDANTKTRSTRHSMGYDMWCST